MTQSSVRDLTTNPKPKPKPKDRLANCLSVLAIFVFVIAVIGELLIDLFDSNLARSGQLLNIAIPLTVNLLIVGAAIKGKIGIRQATLSKKNSPVKFYATLAIFFVVFNSVVILTASSQWFSNS